MVWVYERTESLFVAMLMHARLDVSTVTILVSVTTGVDFLTWFLVLTIVLWVLVGVLAVANRSQLSRPPLVRSDAVNSQHRGWDHFRLPSRENEAINGKHRRDRTLTFKRLKIGFKIKNLDNLSDLHSECNRDVSTVMQEMGHPTIIPA